MGIGIENCETLMRVEERLEMKPHSRIGGTFSAVLAAAVTLAAPALAHHSFAMYDVQQTKVFTGVVTRVDPAPNHLQIFFAPMNAERKNVERDANGDPIVWSVEMSGSAQMARQGVSVNTFPPGTVFSVGLHPLRNGEPGGSREGGLIKCPERTPPAPGMHCDSVEGHVAIGEEPLAHPMP
jgi:hypothetical protein